MHAVAAFGPTSGKRLHAKEGARKWRVAAAFVPRRERCLSLHATMMPPSCNLKTTLSEAASAPCATTINQAGGTKKEITPKMIAERFDHWIAKKRSKKIHGGYIGKICAALDVSSMNTQGACSHTMREENSE